MDATFEGILEEIVRRVVREELKAAVPRVDAAERRAFMHAP